MGLEEGDVLRSVNGQQVTDPGQAMQMMSGLRGVNSISIQVLRDGHPTTLTYQIQ
jgi:general secretion pathway protein C